MEDAPGARIAQPPIEGAARIARQHRNAKLRSPVITATRSATFERASRPAGAGSSVFLDAHARGTGGNGGRDRAQMGLDRELVAGLFARARQEQGHDAYL